MVLRQQNSKFKIAWGKTYANKIQNTEIWNFHLGSDQVARKCPKGCQGRKLSFDDLSYEQNIVSILAEMRQDFDKIIGDCRVFPTMAESTEKNQPERQLSPASILLWILSITYVYILLFSPPKQLLPGEPVWLIQPQTLGEVFNESINFFFILPILNALGFQATLAPVVHPTIEGLFNFAEAWIFMFLPLLLADKRGRKLPQVLIWSLAMFLTNVFLSPYMALRAQNQLEVVKEQPNKGLIARVFGGIGLIVGSIAIIWSLIARPEFGDFTVRIQFFWENIQQNRVTIAFCVDLLLFALFQAILMGEIEPPNSSKRWLRFIPFWGLAIWLII